MRAIIAGALTSIVCLAGIAAGAGLEQQQSLRPPCVPLVACDPYFSIWSPADKLTDRGTVHWTGKPHTLASLVRIDGKAYRLMGAEPQDIEALPQKSLAVKPTRTIYEFEGAGVRVGLTFFTAALPYDIAVLSRPVTYLIWEARSTDGKAHAVQVYYDNTAELVVNEPGQVVQWGQEMMGSLTVLKLGSKEQPILAKRGDDLRIDWGWLYVATPASASTTGTIVPR